ncbi:DUF6233 domain-containing protein [Streptomyces sp. NBC_00208]|uniref:DUF6233 domain-containing protein n=1 Tax=Streptomyces sp. NBC_00208 TaxID=2975681 RepID=UPI002E2D7C4F|nr:DUF6233 domain-containing protein [Streptomyces sp. NBC_00208]
MPRLPTLRTWYSLWGDRIDEAIAAAEQRERERQQGEERRPPTPDWIVELSIGVGARPIEVHVGGCYAAGKRQRVITREQALTALADGMRACNADKIAAQLQARAARMLPSAVSVVRQGGLRAAGTPVLPAVRRSLPPHSHRGERMTTCSPPKGSRLPPRTTSAA